MAGIKDNGHSPDMRESQPLRGRTVVITGTSRGIGAAAAVAFAQAGADIIGTHVNPHPKRIDMQDGILEDCRKVNPNGKFISIVSDITDPLDRTRLLETAVGDTSDPVRSVDVLVLNAAGGLERGKEEGYAKKINFEANMALMDMFTPHMSRGSIVIFTQSMWGHLYGEIGQEPEYKQIAESKHMAEIELKRRIQELEERGIRVGILVGDVVSGTAIFGLVGRRDKDRLEREEKLVPGEKYPTPEDMARAMLDMVLTPRESGYTRYVGRDRETYLAQVFNGASTLNQT